MPSDPRHFPPGSSERSVLEVDAELRQLVAQVGRQQAQMAGLAGVALVSLLLAILPWLSKAGVLEPGVLRAERIELGVGEARITLDEREIRLVREGGRQVLLDATSLVITEEDLRTSISGAKVQVDARGFEGVLAPQSVGLRTSDGPSSVSLGLEVTRASASARLRVGEPGGSSLSTLEVARPGDATGGTARLSLMAGPGEQARLDATEGDPGQPVLTLRGRDGTTSLAAGDPLSR